MLPARAGWNMLPMHEEGCMFDRRKKHQAWISCQVTSVAQEGGEGFDHSERGGTHWSGREGSWHIHVRVSMAGET